MPSSSSTMPKVKRAWPVCGSSPTAPSSRPRNSAAMPMETERPSTAVTVASDSTISAK
jgi:hypothetical protein